MKSKVALLHGTWAGVVSSDDGGSGDDEGGDPVFGSPRQHTLLVMLAGVGVADAGGRSGGTLLPRTGIRCGSTPTRRYKGSGLGWASPGRKWRGRPQGTRRRHTGFHIKH